MNEPDWQLPEPQMLGVAALKALGHPIRARLFNELSLLGPSTATKLGLRLGESSGSTSYHLRQLAKYDLVEERADQGSGRERVWQRAPGAVRIGGPDAETTPTALAATSLASLSFHDAMHDVIRTSMASLPEEEPEWRDAADFSTVWLRLTSNELADLSARVHAVIREFRRAGEPGSESVSGSRRVYANLNFAPVALEQEDAT